VATILLIPFCPSFMRTGKEWFNNEDFQFISIRNKLNTIKAITCSL